MLQNVLTIMFLTLSQGQDIPNLIGKFESSIRVRNRDSIRYYYNRIRSFAANTDGYVSFYLNGFAIFKMLTADSLFRNQNYLDSAIFYMEKCISLNPNFSDAYAVLGSLYGFKAIANLSKVFYYGRKSSECFDKAKKLNPENPRAYYLEGVGLFFRPKSFGGNKEKAISHFQKAVNFYQKEMDNPLSWGYLDCMAFLGFALEHVGKKDDALKVYLGVLEIEPNYKWVRERVEKIKLSYGN